MCLRVGAKSGVGGEAHRDENHHCCALCEGLILCNAAI